MRAEVRADEVEVEEVTRGRDVQAARLPQPRRAKAPGPASNRSFDLTLPPAESSLERTALRSLFPARIGSGRSNLLAVDLACGRSSSDSGAPNMSSRARSEWLRAFVISQSSSTSLSDSRLTLAAPLSIPSLVVNLTHSSLRGEHRDGFTPRTPRCRGPRTQAAVCPQHPLSGPVAQATVPCNCWTAHGPQASPRAPQQARRQ